MLKGLETGVGKPGHDLASPVEEYVSSGLETWVGKPGHDVASPNRNKRYIYMHVFVYVVCMYVS